MKIKKGQTYHLVELPHGLIITYPNVPHGNAEPLVIADAHDLSAYLVRYLQARESGLNLKDAHKAALADAVVLRKGKQDDAETPVVKPS